MKNESRIVRLHARDSDTDAIYDLKMEYDLDELGGEFPAVGDLIVDPGVVGGLDRRDVNNRTIYRVLQRYFMPRAHDGDMRYMALVVEVRTAAEAEAAIATVA